MGGALGAALGWPVEFLKWTEIEKIYGPDGIRRPTQMTDDTQVTLFTGRRPSLIF